MKTKIRAAVRALKRTRATESLITMFQIVDQLNWISVMTASTGRAEEVGED